MGTHEPTSLREAGVLRPGRLLAQLAFFLVGMGLLAGCAWYALRGDRAEEAVERLRQADPALVALMLGCTVVSLLTNATTFWLFIQPVQPLRWRDMQLLNVVANALNYAPIRLGLIARIAYHLRVDRMPIMRLGAWFAAIALVMFMVTGALLLATFARTTLDLWWIAIVLAGIVLGASATRFTATLPFIAQRAPGVDAMLGRPPVLWGAIALRLVDLSAYVGRAAAAAAIVGLPLDNASAAVTLGLVAFLAGLIPARIGFREVAVALAAARLATDAETLEHNVALFALVESAGEAVIFIPLGALSLVWYAKKWKQAREAAA